MITPNLSTHFSNTWEIQRGWQIIPTLGRKNNAQTLPRQLREIISVYKSRNYINSEGNKLWKPINLCSGFQTTFSFSPSPLPAKLRHQVCNWRITAMILAKVTKLQLKALGSRKFQQTNVYWSIPTPPQLTTLPPSPQGIIIIYHLSHYFLRNIY